MTFKNSSYIKLAIYGQMFYSSQKFESVLCIGISVLCISVLCISVLCISLRNRGLIPKTLQHVNQRTTWISLVKHFFFFSIQYLSCLLGVWYPEHSQLPFSCVLSLLALSSGMQFHDSNPSVLGIYFGIWLETQCVNAVGRRRAVGGPPSTSPTGSCRGGASSAPRDLSGQNRGDQSNTESLSILPKTVCILLMVISPYIHVVKVWQRLGFSGTGINSQLLHIIF